MARAEPLVTIVIPSYNMAGTIRQAIDSCLAQTHRNMQIVVVDDGSTDETRQFVAAYTDARIVYIHRENAGLSAARNLGLSVAEGRYLVFLDADDRLLPGKLWRQADYMESHAGVTMVTGNSVRTDQQGRVLYRLHRPAGRISATDMFYRNTFPIHAAMIRRGAAMIVGEFEPTLAGGEDWDYFCRMMLMGGIVAHDPHPVCEYRTSRSSMSAAPERQTQALLTVIQRTFSHSNMPIALTPMRPFAEAEVYLNGAVKAFGAGDHALGAKYLGESVERDPELLSENGKPIVDRLIYFSRALNDGEKMPFLDGFFRHQPFEQINAAKWKSAAPFLLGMERLHLQLDRGERIAAARQAAMVAASHPIRSTLRLLKSRKR